MCLLQPYSGRKGQLLGGSLTHHQTTLASASTEHRTDILVAVMRPLLVGVNNPTFIAHALCICAALLRCEVDEACTSAMHVVLTGEC